MKWVLVIAALAASAALGSAPPSASAYTPDHLSPRSAYLERCGGCHGVDGLGHTALVPDLKGKAGYFLCTGQGRDYVSRLPNIVFSRLTDAELAALLNYVAFELGAPNAPPHARPFTAAELAGARRKALTIPDLEAYRGRVVAGLIAGCGAPASLNTDYQTAK